MSEQPVEELASSVCGLTEGKCKGLEFFGAQALQVNQVLSHCSGGVLQDVVDDQEGDVNRNVEDGRLQERARCHGGSLACKLHGLVE